MLPPRCQGHANNGCPYCANMLEGVLYLIPDLEAKYGHDARFQFKNGHDAQFRFREGRNMAVVARRYNSSNKPVDLEYFWYTVGQSPFHFPPGDTSSPTTLSQAEFWIQSCLASHKLCSPYSSPSPLPTRILDLGDDPSSPTIKLVLPSPADRAPYIALSHSWGCSQPLTTTTTTLDSHLSPGIPLTSLPPTFADAILITRRLGLRHLWIDSLCIIQDSPADWSVQASLMGQVYRNSYLTLSATASSSPHTGIFRTRQAVHIAADPLPDAETLDTLFPQAAKLREDLRLFLRFAIVHPNLKRFANPAMQKRDLPLMTRAWAYQERLASRVLHYGPHEVWWECMQDLDCECGEMAWNRDAQHMSSYGNVDTTGRLPPKVSNYAALHVRTASKGTDAGSKKLMARWQEMVEEYTLRELKFSEDRLPALSGMAEEMRQALGMRYVAGHWQKTLPVALLWERQAMGMPARIRWGEERPAPSWSWASVDGPVRFVVPLAGQPADAMPEVFAEAGEVKIVPAGRMRGGRWTWASRM